MEWTVYRVVLLGLELSLLEVNNYEDDSKLGLSKFNYEVDIEYIKNILDSDFAEEWVKIFTIVIGRFLSRDLKSECIVVKNTQVLIERMIPNL